MVEALREIVAASSDTAASIRRVAEIAEEMTRLAATLEERVRRFTLTEDGRRPQAPAPGPA